MIVLGIMLRDGVAAPQMSKVPYYWDRNPKRGVELIEKGMNIRCFYIQPVAILGAGERSCFAERSPAIWVAPMFRDGASFISVERDQEKANEWYKRDKACNAYIDSHSPIMRCF
jgi:hypothetical protein